MAHYGVKPGSKYCEAPKQVTMSLGRVIGSHLKRASIHRRDLRHLLVW